MDGDGRRMRRRGSFDEDPDIYQMARPDYPRRVYEVLSGMGLGPGARVLEIGPGTGQATRPLVAAGASVLAVELGGHLAARLRTDLAGHDVTVIEGDFVTVPLPDGDVDLAVCATTFHWLDPDAAVRRLARLVWPGGGLAVWWTVFGDPDRIPPWRAEVDRLYRRWLPGEKVRPGDLPAVMRVAERTAELAAGGWFGPVQVEMIRWEHQLTPRRVRGLWATFSAVRELSADRRRSLLDGVAEVVASQPGGVAVDNYVTALYTAPRRDDSGPRRGASGPSTR
ncbi:class I SAM-dependent methyltransferase [Salinispora tropica]|uniref:class I SAM-dependent methyltransferase n=1 Tax=Salinispora tropica TaxID=168695 RepID=UPI00048D260A|nr:class I SAM-dependent methyltransferase [Salinispora tropica]